MTLTFQERRIAFGICCGMSPRQMANALEMPLNTVNCMLTRLLDKSGMDNRFEFAMTQNCAVRELMYGEPRKAA